jgi:hypothetical protein
MISHPTNTPNLRTFPHPQPHTTYTHPTNTPHALMSISNGHPTNSRNTTTSTPRYRDTCQNTSHNRNTQNRDRFHPTPPVTQISIFEFELNTFSPHISPSTEPTTPTPAFKCRHLRPARMASPTRLSAHTPHPSHSQRPSIHPSPHELHTVFPEIAPPRPRYLAHPPYGGPFV